jgi:predicted alpha-1,2-mannosidase
MVYTKWFSVFSLLFLAEFTQAQEVPLISFVNPFIGTHKMGHTFPGASVPFGAVQLSPDTDTLPYAHLGKYNPEVYAYCAGYQYADKTIVGFSHTHFSGTGHSDLGDFLIMPTLGTLQLNPGTQDKPETGFRSRFQHEKENAEPGYYSVWLEDYGVKAEMTCSARTGYHRYHFPETDEAHIILDLISNIYPYEEKNVWTSVRIINDTLVTGYRQTEGWARERTLYFAMIFNRPFKEYGCKNFAPNTTYKGFWGKFDQSKNHPELAGKQLRLHFDFSAEEGVPLEIKFALSPVSTNNALENARKEIPHWNFEKAKRDAQDLWEKELQKIKIEAQTPDDKVNFYTAMYHAALMPHLYMDADSSYRGLDGNVYKAEGFTHYTSFSVWDTFRAFHPLLQWLSPSLNADIVQSMLAHFKQNTLQMLPIWSHHGNENWCMTGYHSVCVLADAILKGAPKIEPMEALEAALLTSRQYHYENIGDYLEYGYIPFERSGVSVSTTLEYAYDDWCIAQLAHYLNQEELQAEYTLRSQHWKNVFDAQSGFMRPRSQHGNFKSPFDPLHTHGQGFIEGNAWNFGFFVPHDPPQLIELMGGNERFVERLDSLFSMDLPEEYFKDTEDISREGILGNYVHGNEPAHHVAYLYNWTHEPWKTQEKVRLILQHQYKNAPDGLGGNEDAGQMSAWYIFSALGFYPVSPGNTLYALGSPLVHKATIQMENGNTLYIEALNQSENNLYVQQVTLNGQILGKPWIEHQQLLQGGHLVFTMSANPPK